jgi:hypothetical protein
VRSYSAGYVDGVVGELRATPQRAVDHTGRPVEAVTFGPHTGQSAHIGRPSINNDSGEGQTMGARGT